MKIIFEFNSEEPDDLNLHTRMLESPRVMYAISSFDDWLRCRLKYQDEPEATQKILTEVREKLWETFDNHNVSHLLLS